MFVLGGGWAKGELAFSRAQFHFSTRSFIATIATSTTKHRVLFRRISWPPSFTQLRRPTARQPGGGGLPGACRCCRTASCSGFGSWNGRGSSPGGWLTRKKNTHTPQDIKTTPKQGFASLLNILDKKGEQYTAHNPVIPVCLYSFRLYLDLQRTGTTSDMYPHAHRRSPKILPRGFVDVPLPQLNRLHFSQAPSTPPICPAAPPPPPVCSPAERCLLCARG